MPKWPKEIQTPLCDFMNQQQAHHLLLLAKQLADQKDTLTVTMVGIDADGVRLLAQTPHGEERLMVPFMPPLQSYEEAKMRLLQLGCIDN